MKTTVIPTYIKAFIEAQQNHDSDAYAKSFTPNAEVFDEGETHHGHHEIKQWIKNANEKYNSKMEFIDYVEQSSSGTLKAKVSGTFPGSPIVLTYELKFENSLISSLKIR
jgi:hypothetical protein